LARTVTLSRHDQWLKSRRTQLFASQQDTAKISDNARPESPSATRRPDIHNLINQFPSRDALWKQTPILATRWSLNRNNDNSSTDQ
jgi:hypothetical protein